MVIRSIIVNLCCGQDVAEDRSHLDALSPTCIHFGRVSLVWPWASPCRRRPHCHEFSLDRGSGMAGFEPEPGDLVANLDTPSILCDLDRLEWNIAEWQAIMDRNGVRFRPHIKTHKIPEIARLQLDAGARGIICAKPSEAEPFVDAGVDDVCIAYPVFGATKWRRIALMASRGVRTTVNCDNQVAARQASEAAVAAGVVVNLQIDLAGKLRAAGLEVREVTAGGSFTGKWVAEVPGVTESRAGTYVFYDLMHLGAGTAASDQLALSALCTVVSHRTPERLTIDGGSKTFSGDGGVIGGSGAGSRDIARAADRQVFVERLTEEHGMARAEEPVELGEKLRFYPFHACTCANLTNQIIGFRGDRVETVWTVAARGLRT